MNKFGKPYYLEFKDINTPFFDFEITKSFLRGYRDILFIRIHLTSPIKLDYSGFPENLEYCLCYGENEECKTIHYVKHNVEFKDQSILKIKVNRYHVGIEITKIRFKVHPFLNCKLPVFFNYENSSYE